MVVHGLNLKIAWTLIAGVLMFGQVLWWFLRFGGLIRRARP